MHVTGYRDAQDVLNDRIRWARATLAGLVDRGREEGWIDGARTQVADDPRRIEDEIVGRFAATALVPAAMPMEWLALRLDLSRDELAALWLLACIEVSPSLARVAQVFGIADCPELSLQIVRQLVPLTDAGLDALEQRGLIELKEDPIRGHHRRLIRASDRVIALARGELALDRELRDLVEIRDAAIGPCPAALSESLRAAERPLLLAVGPDGSGRAAALARAAGAAKLGTLRVRCVGLGNETALLRRQVRAVLREACLFGVVPLFEGFDAKPDVIAALDRELTSFAGPVMATVCRAVRVTARPVVVHRVERPDTVTRRRIWSELLGGDPSVSEAAAERYTLWPGAIAASARNAIAIASDEVTFADVHEGVRAHLGEQLEDLAKRVEWRQTWNDVVLPRDQFDQLIELVARVRQRSQVLEGWGFGDKIGKGHGMAALFSGPPGTGKTMVAGLIAQELGLDLYQVDLSSVVSKYIGETEKQLAKLFDAAESGQAIILFDEADSLFAKRTQVKSSNDRYANLEVNYLLQRLEAFTGVCLLTTNHESGIDEAFRRRISVHVRFPMPDEAQRTELWRSMLPDRAEVAKGIDPVELARSFAMSGGYIKNAALRAAYLAADRRSPITMAHLIYAARAEYEAMGKIAHDRSALHA